MTRDPRASYVSGVENFKSVNLAKAAVEQSVNEDAEKGQPASQEVQQAVATTGLPKNMNAPANIDQFAAVVNMMGGNQMMMFMMMMMNPQFMQMMMKIQGQEGATMKDMADKVAEKEPKLNEFDKEFKEALALSRADMKILSKSTIKKLIKVLKRKPLDNLDIGTVPYNDKININSSKSIIGLLSDHFRFTKEDKEYNTDKSKPGDLDLNSENIVEQLTYIVLYNIFNVEKVSYKDEDSLDCSHRNLLYAAALIAENILNVDSRYSDSLKDEYISSLQLQHTLGKNMITPFGDNKKPSEIVSTLKDKYKIESEIALMTNGNNLFAFKDKDNLDKLKVAYEDSFKKVSQNLSLSSTKSEPESMKDNYKRRSPVLKMQKSSNNKVMNESEFLKKEFKRLWKL